MLNYYREAACQFNSVCFAGHQCLGAWRIALITNNASSCCLIEPHRVTGNSETKAKPLLQPRSPVERPPAVNGGVVIPDGATCSFTLVVASNANYQPG